MLIHAFPLGARMYEPQLVLAERGWRIVAPQLRQFDGAPTDPPAASFDDYAGDIIDLLDGLHVTEAVIGGVSMGGYIAFAMFRRAPTYFQGLILADTRSQADTPEGIENRKKMLALVTEKGPAAVADEMLPKLISEETRRNQPAVERRVRELILANSADAIAGAIRGLMTRPDATPLLRTIHCPTLIVVGRDDGITPVAMSEQMQNAIAGSQLVVIEHAGHLANIEQPTAFNDAVGRFLDSRV